jgi:CheY-like chemotaxis protein
MRILILDDDKTLLSTFKQRLIGHDICCVETSSDAIKKLSEEKWDAVFLDHDLAGQTYAPSGPGTGYEVAQWLSENSEKIPNKVILHTFNGPGAQNMLNILPNAFYNPGAWINREMGI